MSQNGYSARSRRDPAPRVTIARAKAPKRGLQHVVAAAPTACNAWRALHVVAAERTSQSERSREYLAERIVEVKDRGSMWHLERYASRASYGLLAFTTAGPSAGAATSGIFLGVEASLWIPLPAGPGSESGVADCCAVYRLLGARSCH